MQIESSNVAYTGLTKQFSKSLFEHKEAISAVRNNVSKGIVGHIPDKWVKQIPYENRRANITEFHKTMGCFVNRILPLTRDSKFSSFVLTKIMRHSNVISKDSSVALKYIGKGDFGKGYSIINKKTGDAFFLKKFNHKYDSDYLWTFQHGILQEANNKMYVKSNFKKKDKSLFSNFHYADIKNGYYIEDYLSDKNDIAQGVKSAFERRNIYFDASYPNHLLYKVQSVLKKRGLQHGDLSVSNVKIYNDVNGYKVKCFDLGGLEELPSEVRKWM